MTTCAVGANSFVFDGMEWGPPDGPLLLLLHGFPQSHTSWSLVATRLAAVGIHCVAVDQRGYSAGARPADVGSYALPLLVGDAVALIEALGGPSGAVHLAGHDWGGVVGWQVAARYPRSVLSWTAVSTPNPSALAAVLAVDASQRAKFGYVRHFREVGVAERDLLAKDGALLRSFYGGVVAPEQVDADVAFFSQPGVLTAALNWYRAMAPSTDSADVPRVSVPSSFVWGSEDLAFGRDAAARSGDFVDAPYEFVPLEGASHWLLDEAPDTVAETIAARVLG